MRDAGIRHDSGGWAAVLAASALALAAAPGYGAAEGANRPAPAAPSARPSRLTNRPTARQAGVGAKYGTRDPVTCARGSTPRGAPTVAQVAQLVRCDREGEGSYSVTLVEHLRVEVAGPRAYVHVQDSYEDVDPRQPLYPIRGMLTVYTCDALRTPREIAGGFQSNRGTNCSSYEEPRASGVCYRDHFGDLHCRLYDTRADLVTTKARNIPPPR